MTSKITVQTNSGGATHNDADGWTVDDRGDLHIIKKDGSKNQTIATHAHGHWSSVVRLEVTPAPSVTYAVAQGICDGLAGGGAAHLRGAR